MTTLNPPPNWYRDPTGRHETRYWDGAAWTAHVGDAGHAGTDPLHRLAESDPQGAIGPGTAQLQALARARQEIGADTGDGRGPISAAAYPDAQGEIRHPTLAPRRRRALLDVATIGFAAFVVVAGVALLASTGVFHRGARGEERLGLGSSVEGDGYRVQVPAAWQRVDVPDGVDLDARYIVDGERAVVVGIGDAPDPTRDFTDPVRRNESLATLGRLVLAASGADGRVVEARFLDGFGRPTGVVTVDAVAADGSTVRVVEYVVVDGTRVVFIAISGSPDAIVRQEPAVSTVVRSVDFD